MRDIRKEVINKLKNDSALTTLLASGANSVYMNYSENAGSYPVVVVHIVDEVADAFADNDEVWNRVRYQITIITTDAEYNNIEQRIKLDMKELGFVRSITTDFKEGSLHYRVLQFVIGLQP